MSFLAPLYALAALAIAAPILFHFLQRRPQGQQEFSSLMFLRPSPPQLTRRHRLSNLLLLLLRAAALLLLAAAFARPFLRSATLLDLEAPARSVALVIDTSASMRQDGVWQQTLQSAQRVVDDLRPTDQVSLIRFDRQVQTLISFEAWEDADPAKRVPLLREQLAALKPTWHTTQLGPALIAASDSLLQQRLAENHHQPLQIVLLSDLQTGSDLEALQSYQWPAEIALDLLSSAPTWPSNASLQALPPVAEEMDASQLRVLVRNENNSEKAQFQLVWKGGDNGQPPIDVHVPPGQTRVVRVHQPTAAEELVLRGDDQVFDNTLYVTETTPQEKQLLFVGGTDAGKQSLFFYLQQASLDTRGRRVTIKPFASDDSLATLAPEQIPLVVIAQPLDAAPTADLQRYVQRGGNVLVVLEESTANDTMAKCLEQLLELPDLAIEPVASNDYAMLARIDFQHALFAPFADPRFSDFTKIRFWKHYRLSCSHEEPWQVVARFDDELPALIEKSLDDGTVWILASGWQPAESQLALSTKFVPLLHGMFGGADEIEARLTNYVVGQPVPVSPRRVATTVSGPTGDIMSLAAMSDSFTDTTIPGIYEVRQDADPYHVAVNLAAQESRTEPLTPDRLEQLGVNLGEHKSVEVLREDQRQMRNRELESRQKLWRWGLLTALIAIALETWLGGKRTTSGGEIT